MPFAGHRQTLSAQHCTCKHRESRESRHSTCAAVSVKKRALGAHCPFSPAIFVTGSWLGLSALFFCVYVLRIIFVFFFVFFFDFHTVFASIFTVKWGWDDFSTMPVRFCLRLFNTLFPSTLQDARRASRWILVTVCRTWFLIPDAFALVLWLKTGGAGSFDAHHGNEDRMRARHFRLKRASSVVPKDTFSSPVCLIVLMIDAAVTWKAEIRTYFAAWCIYIPPTLAFTLHVTISVIVKESCFHSDWYCQGRCRMRTERVITVMASVGEFASRLPKKRRTCGVATSGTSIVVVELPLATIPSCCCVPSRTNCWRSLIYLRESTAYR